MQHGGAESASLQVDDALTYARAHGLHALLVERDGERIAEAYGDGWDDARAHALYSGTKSFWGVAACCAQDDGVLDLDERICETLTEWRSGAHRAQVTIRQLLTLTSGIAFGGLGRTVPTFAAAEATDVRDEPGTRFTYGGIPLQVFGAVLQRKLGRDPLAYLHERVLDRLGIAVASWRRLTDGSPTLPTGASLGAAEWAKFGRFLANDGTAKGACVLPTTALAPAFVGSAANPHYGLGFWLHPLTADDDIVHASGSGGQALYILRASRTVVVHFGESRSWRHETFLRRLLGVTPSRGRGARRTKAD